MSFMVLPWTGAGGSAGWNLGTGSNWLAENGPSNPRKISG